MSDAQKSTGQWVQVAAGLKNASMRQLLGVVLAGDSLPEELSKTQQKDLARWEKIGLLHHEEHGWSLNHQLLDQTLASASAHKADRSGIQRFFTGARLHTLPAKPGDRHEVLVYIRDAVISADEQLREEQLNERLRVFHPDVALLRRYLVDHSLLLRATDGSSYRLGSVT